MTARELERRKAAFEETAERMTRIRGHLPIFRSHRPTPPCSSSVASVSA